MFIARDTFIELFCSFGADNNQTVASGYKYFAPTVRSNYANGPGNCRLAAVLNRFTGGFGYSVQAPRFCARLALKQLLQSTGRPGAGLKGTLSGLPH